MAIKALKILVLSPVVILLVTATRLLLIANYDTTGALAIASAGGITGTLVGTVIPLLPPYLPALTVLAGLLQKRGIFIFFAIATAIVSPVYGDPRPAFHATIDEVSQLFDFALANNWRATWEQLWEHHRLLTSTFLLGVAITLVTFYGFFTKGLFAAALLNLGWGILIATALCPAPMFIQKVYRVPFDAVIVSEGLRRPWIPAEEITLKSNEIRVGYTLSTKDGWFLVLNDGDRTVEYIKSDQVTGRRVCSVKTPEKKLPALALKGAVIPASPVCGEPRA